MNIKKVLLGLAISFLLFVVSYVVLWGLVIISVRINPALVYFYWLAPTAFISKYPIPTAIFLVLPFLVFNFLAARFFAKGISVKRGVKFGYLFILIIFLLVGLTYLEMKEMERYYPLSVEERKLNPRIFTGIVLEVNKGCFVDAVCYIVVDGKKVIFDSGAIPDDGSSPVWGKVYGTLSVGKEVEVYAKQNSSTEYSLYGNTKYYIMVKNN